MGREREGKGKREGTKKSLFSFENFNSFRSQLFGWLQFEKRSSCQKIAVK
jgi:hypothetical protein